MASEHAPLGETASSRGVSVFLAGVAAVAGFVVGHFVSLGPTTVDAVSGSEGTPKGNAVFDVASLDISDPVARARRFLAMLEPLDAAEFPEAAKQLHGRRDEWAVFEARLFIWAWSEVDHVGALAGALEWSGLRDTVAYSAVRSWARVDPIAAQQAVRLELEDAEGNLGTSLLSGLAYGWAESGDFDGALQLIEARFQSLVHRETVTELVMEEMLRVRGPAASFAWAEELASRNEDRAFLSIVFRKLGRNAILIEPEATAEWLDGFEGHPSYMNRARRAAAMMWARSDPSAGLAWMISQPATQERRIEGLTTILADWATRDASAARGWLREAPRDPVLDEGVARAAGSIARKSPRDALAWVAFVRDPNLREETLVAVAAQWVGSDPAAASTWMAEAGLSEEVRRRIDAARQRS